MQVRAHTEALVQAGLPVFNERTGVFGCSYVGVRFVMRCGERTRLGYGSPS